jgi:hypothetical protein
MNAALFGSQINGRRQASPTPLGVMLQCRKRRFNAAEWWGVTGQYCGATGRCLIELGVPQALFPEKVGLVYSLLLC